ncbi:MAG: hypothetical protein ACP5NC_07040 [Nitrososphaeria archaeon]
MNYLMELERKTSYGTLFEMVKRIVERYTGLHRAGLTLLLSNLPTNIAAYYPVNSNYIVLNRFLTERIREVVKNELEFNSFILVVLLHEYLHSLGFLDEANVRNRVRDICASVFGTESIVYEQALSNWLEKYPELNVPVKEEKAFRIIRDFDYESQKYIG